MADDKYCRQLSRILVLGDTAPNAKCLVPRASRSTSIRAVLGTRYTARFGAIDGDRSAKMAVRNLGYLIAEKPPGPQYLIVTYSNEGRFFLAVARPSMPTKNY